MAIGTTVKVGFDATAVRAGFGALQGMFSGAMRGIRQVGIGAARQVGARATDLLGRILMAVPEGIRDALEYGDELNDLSANTGVAVGKLIELQEALRLGGAEFRDTNKVLAKFKQNLDEAKEGAGPAREALHKLGLRMTDIKELSLEQAFEKIGRQIGSLPADMVGLEDAMSELFGFAAGAKLRGFFRNYDENIERARKNTASFAESMGNSAGSYGKMNDAIGRFQMRWIQTMGIVIDEARALFGDDWIDELFDFMDPAKVRAFLSQIKAGATEMFDYFAGGGFKSMFRDFGKMIGEGIMESLKQFNPFGTGGGLFKIFGGGGKETSSVDFSKMLMQGESQTALLRQIANKQTGWA